MDYATYYLVVRKKVARSLTSLSEYILDLSGSEEIKQAVETPPQCPAIKRQQ